MYRAKTSTHCLVKTRHFLAPCNSPPAASQPLPLPWHAPKWVKDFSLGRSPRNPRKSHQALKAFQKKLCSATERGKKFIATLAPARASSIAIARPIPCEAPVTSAVFPSTLPTGDFSRFVIVFCSVATFMVFRKAIGTANRLPWPRGRRGHQEYHCYTGLIKLLSTS
jgi:hypothetical protein